MLRTLWKLLKPVLLLVLVAGVVIAVLFAYTRGLIPGLGTTYTVNTTIILDGIQQLSSLTVTRYNYSSTVYTERDMPDFLKFLYGDRQVMVAVGSVTAGIDMTRVQPQDVIWDGQVLSLRLPAPTLQDCFLDDGATYIADQQTGLFARRDPNIDQNTRRYVVGQFRDAALAGDILSQAQTQAEQVIRQFVTLVSSDAVRRIDITFQPPDPNAPLPETCS
jgi:hypothetical protein